MSKIDNSKDSMGCLILIEYSSKHLIEFKVILVLQSSPTNPWAQLHEKELTPSTQMPSFLQGLDRQSLMSENMYFSTCLLSNLYHQKVIMLSFKVLSF